MVSGPLPMTMGLWCSTAIDTSSESHDTILQENISDSKLNEILPRELVDVQKGKMKTSAKVHRKRRRWHFLTVSPTHRWRGNVIFHKVRAAHSFSKPYLLDLPKLEFFAIVYELNTSI